MKFQKENLEGTHYNWPPTNGSTFTGQPSRRGFDPYNGEQVLFLINYFGSLSEEFTLQEGRMVELKIMNELPLDKRSEISVLNWMQELG